MKNAALEQQAEFPPELAMNYGDDTGMDDETFKGIVDSEISAAVSFIDSDIGPLRAEAMRYYRGDPLGNEEAGRSQIVSRDVADTVNAILPSLVRMMCGGENVVEFVPESEEDEEVAEQQTDYVNYIVMRDNPGFEIVLAVCKNALREKVGIVKYWWDDSVEVTTRRYTGLDMDGLTKLLEDISASLEYEITDKEEIEGPPDEMGQPTQQLNVTLKLKRKRDRVAIAAVPPEEFLICRDAVSLDTARFVAHRRDLTVSELVAMGYDRHDAATSVRTYWDLGLDDATAVWFVQIVNREIRLIGYEEWTDTALTQVAKDILAKPYAYEKHVLPHDAEVRELTSAITRRVVIEGILGPKVEIAPRLAVEDGINATRVLFPRMWFDAKGCAHGLECLRNYRKQWDDKRKSFQDRPYHDWSSHGADALRMLGLTFREELKSAGPLKRNIKGIV